MKTWIHINPMFIITNIQTDINHKKDSQKLTMRVVSTGSIIFSMMALKAMTLYPINNSNT
jgi:hypothetical protein